MDKALLPAKIDQLEKVYKVREEVLPFLAAHPDLVDLLLETRPHFERHFGRDIVVVLRFPIRFPEDTEDDVFVSIQSPFDVKTTLEKEKRFWNEWFGEASGRPGGSLMTIQVDFVGENA
jgi:hypothetical protein